MTNTNDLTRQRLLEQIRDRPALTRSQWQWRRTSAMAAGASWIIACTLVLRRHPPADATAWALVASSWFALLAIATSWGVLAHPSSTLGVNHATRIRLAWFTILSSYGAAWLAQSRVEPSQSEPNVAASLACFATAIVVAVGPMVALLYVEHRSDYVRPRATGLLLGSASGALGGLGLSFHCAESEFWHLGIGHIAPMLVLASLGFALGHRVLAGGRLAGSENRSAGDSANG